MIRLLLLMILPTLFYSPFLFGQSRLTDEDVFIYYLKRKTDSQNPSVSQEDYQIYCTTFDGSNFSKTKNNEFERQEYYTKMTAKINSKIKALTYEKVFSTEPSYSDLTEYDFNSGSFGLKYGPGIKTFKFSYFSLDPTWYNYDKDFPSLRIKMNSTEAKQLLDSKKDINGNTNRRVYLVLKFNFMDIDLTQTGGGLGNPLKYFFSIYCRQVDIYNDQYLSRKIASISANASITNSVTGNSSLLNNSTVFSFFESSWKLVKTENNISLEDAKAIATPQQWIFRVEEYKNAKLLNPVKYYYYDGLLYGTGSFINNNTNNENRNGIELIYFRSGAKAWETHYSMGRIVEYQVGWFENGKLKYVQGYDSQGNKAGPHIEYNQDGERTVQERYYGGNLIANESGRNYNSAFTDRGITQYGFVLPDVGHIIYNPKSN